MQYRFSNKISQLKPSAIREILKATSDPTIIPFAAGNPCVEAFPEKEIQEISNKVLTQTPTTVLQYNVSEGYPPLRELLKKRLKSKEIISFDQNDLMIVSGAQQAIDLVGKAFFNDDDIVLCESPSFVGALNSLKSNGAKLVGVPLEFDGIDPYQFEQTIIDNKNVKALYIIPNFQNPTGITTSLHKRKKIYDICVKHNIIIIEDNPYGDLSFTDNYIPSIKSMDTKGIVVYCGSLSKVLAPGIRVGYVVANNDIMNKLVIAKQTSDVHTNVWSQLIAYEFIENYDFDGHIRNIRSIYKKKYELMSSLMDEHFSDKIGRTKPDGGLFIWCTAPIETNINDFCKASIAKKVAIVPGIAFLPYENTPTVPAFRMNFSTPSDEQIVKGVKILGDLTKTL